MATFRVGVGSFNIQDGAVGFGTDIDGLGNLRVKGVTKTTGSIVSGASTLTRYSGFAADNINQLENITLTSEVGTIGDIVVGVGTSVIISSGSTVTVGTVESVSIGTHFSPPVGGIEERGQDFIEGMMRFNTDLNTMEFYNGNEWRQFTYISDIQNSPSSRGRGIVGGGNPSPNFTDTIQFFNISSLGNAISFGNLSNGARFALGGGSDGIRGIFYAGQDGPSTPRNFIDQITMASEGDSIDFGDASSAGRCMGGCGSSTRGIFGGINAGNTADTIQYATKGSTISSFVTFAVSGGNKNAMFSSPVKLVNRSGQGQISLEGELSSIQTMDTGIIASGGNTVQFGGLMNTVEQQKRGTCNNTRGIFCGGYKAYSPYPNVNVIDFINIQSEGNAENFGDLTEARNQLSCMTNATRATLAGGGFPGFKTIDFLTIASTGNGQDFGDLFEGVSAAYGISDTNGGLGGF